MITVAELMTVGVQGLAPEDTLDRALAMMDKYGYHHIPVLEGERIVGIVSHRDILRALGSTLKPGEGQVLPEDVQMAEIMVDDVFAISPDTPLRKAAIYIRTQRYGCLPVVEGGKLVGIITDSDFVNIAIDLLEQLEDGEPPELEAI